MQTIYLDRLIKYKIPSERTGQTFPLDVLHVLRFVGFLLRAEVRTEKRPVEQHRISAYRNRAVPIAETQSGETRLL